MPGCNVTLRAKSIHVRPLKVLIFLPQKIFFLLLKVLLAEVLLVNIALAKMMGKWSGWKNPEIIL